MSRTMELDSFHRLLERARAHSFPLSKRARLFPSAAYRRSAPPQLALGRLKGKPVGMLRRRLDGFPKFGGESTQTLLFGIFQRSLNIFVT